MVRRRYVPARPAAVHVDDPAAPGGRRGFLQELTQDPGPIHLDTLLAEIVKLERVKAIGLFPGLFEGVSEKVVAGWRSRAMYGSSCAAPTPVTRSKGGDREYLHWATATVRLLPRLLTGRTTVPVFLAERRSPATGNRARALADVDFLGELQDGPSQQPQGVDRRLRLLTLRSVQFEEWLRALRAWSSWEGGMLGDG